MLLKAQPVITSMEWKNRKVLITGGNGFIGSHLAEDLVQKDADVALLVRPESSLYRVEHLLKQLKIVQCDISDSEGLKKVVAEVKPEYVFHLAGLPNPARDASLIAPMNKVNTEGTLNMLVAVTGVGIKSFVFPGTSEDYGHNPTPFVETQPLDPISPYSTSKCSAELWCKSFSNDYDVPTVIIRPFQVYGSKQKPRMFIPSLIDSIVKGKDFEMTPGEQKRDFIHIDDVVELMELAAQSKHQKGDVFNAATGKPVTVAELAETLVEVTGSNIKINKTLPYRKSEVDMIADISKAKKLLGWTPKVTLEEGLKRTFEWYKQNS